MFWIGSWDSSRDEACVCMYSKRESSIVTTLKRYLEAQAFQLKFSSSDFQPLLINVLPEVFCFPETKGIDVKDRRISVVASCCFALLLWRRESVGKVLRASTLK